MITIRMIGPSEMDGAKDFIRRIFPDAMVQVTDEDTVFLAEVGGKPVGFAHLIDDGEVVMLQGIGVEKSMRGQGVGTVLLEFILEGLKDTDKPIYLKVKVMNPVIDLYSRYGFMLKKFGDIHVLVKKPNA